MGNVGGEPTDERERGDREKEKDILACVTKSLPSCV